MVRKWSYLDDFNLIHAGDLAPLKALKVFKVFRKTTRFKKFNKGMTRMVRKKYAKRKYQTTWLFLTYITAAWTKNYLKSRQFERFQQSMGVFNACAYSADYDVFKVSSLGLSAEHSINIFSCAKNISNRFINHSNMSKTILSNSLVKEAKLSFVHSTSLTSLAESELAYPVALTYENLMYHPHLENIPNSTYTNLLNTLTESTFKYSLNYVIALRQVLILMSILNTYQNEFMISKTLSFAPSLEIVKVGTTSGASRNITIYKSSLPLQLKHKKLLLNKKWNAGRGASGRVVMWTRRTRSVKSRNPFINYSFRYRNLALVASFIMIPRMNKLISLLFMASGSVTYLPTPTSHELFTLTRFKGVLLGRKKFYKTSERFYPMSVFKQSCFVVRQLPKNKPVSLLESLPGKGIQYVRSTGTKAVILKMDSRVSTALVKLPSGVKKVFSTFSIGSLGGVALPENRKTKNTSAGFYKKHGKKSKVRGVAMNPVDHPHGGRAKAIRYQRTPWGKTTKYK